MKSYLAATFLVLLSVACVPQRKYQDLQKNYEDEAKKSAECNKKYTELQDKNEENLKTLADKETRLSNLQRDATLLDSSYKKLSMLYNQTNDAYEKLLDKVKELESQNKIKTQELSAELLESQRKLNEKDKELTTKQKNLGLLESDLNQSKSELEKLQKDLQEREKRVQELSKVLNQKDSVVNALKTKISSALLSFKDKGMSVAIRNGKVYVSIEEKLLFQSGKYTVNPDGRKALLDLSNALNQQKDISIMVEGHTDNVPYVSSGVIKDNLDLSVMRATEVARILTKDGKVDATRVVAAGRGDTQPIAPNTTPEGRAKNRRTEIILTPQLGELFKILNQE